MRRSLVLSFFLSSLVVLQADPMRLPTRYFTDDHFKKSFVGSYGFLPEVEPKVDAEEARVLAELSELLSLSRFKQAEKRLLAFIKERKNPTEPEKESKGVSAALIFTLGNLYYQNDRLDDAEQAYKLAIKRHESFRRAHKNLAFVYAGQEQISKAKPHLMKAVELGESDHRTFGLLGVALLEEGQLLAAEGAFRQAYLLNPQEKDWQLRLAQTLLQKEDWSQAAALFQSLLDQQPDNALYWKQQANCFIQNGEVMRAAENYEVLRLKGLADEESLNQLGDIYANQQQPLLALGAYLSAMKLSDTVNVDRSLKAAKYLLQLEAPDEATRLMDELEAKGGETMTTEQKVRGLVLRSDIAKAKEDLEQATAHLESVLALDPTNGEARVRLGQLFSQRALDEGKDELKVEARKYFTIALNDADEQVAYQAHLRYAQMLVKDGRYVKAQPLLEQAVRLKKGSKISLEQYLRRVQRAAEREKARKEREDAAREDARAAAEKAIMEQKENE